MSPTAKRATSSSAERVAAYRRRMRAQGLVPKTIWVPDTSDPAFITEYARQAREIAANSESEAEIIRWIEAAQADLDLGPPYPPLPQKT
jgi:hypothetical protein